MLQIMDHSQISPRPPCSTQAAAAKQARIKSRAAELIDAFMAARGAVRVAKTQYDELAAKHPDLCVDDPIIFLFTNGDGDPVHGDFRDIHRFFPASQDKWSPGTKKRREELLNQYGEARRTLAVQRKSTGLTALWDRLALASHEERMRLLALCRYQPTSMREAREQARVIRKYLPDVAHAIGGAVDGERFKIYGASYRYEEYDGWCQARVKAFDFLATFVRALGNAGGR